MNELDLGLTIRGFGAGQKLFARYRLVGILGRGGMGIVWLARDEELERDVALKFLPDLLVHDQSILRALKRETTRALSLTHPNIVRIHDFVNDDHAACISMEYVDGETLSNLRSLKANDVFEPAEITEWLRQLCDALEYAHTKAQIVHRDVKPANLMINSKGELKITDFGIARSLTDSVSMLTHQRGTSGTLVYMSPQQLDGERPTIPDDIYSVGATIYELLTSKPPFYTGAIERQIQEKVAPTIAARRAELGVSTPTPVPAEWEQTVAACLAKDPANRPENSRALAAQLGIGMGTGTAPPLRRRGILDTEATTRPARSRTAIAASIIALLLLGGSAGWWYGVVEPKRSSERQLAADKERAEAAERERREQESREAKAAAEKKELDDRVSAAVAKQVAEEKQRIEEKRKADEAMLAEKNNAEAGRAAAQVAPVSTPEAFATPGAPEPNSVPTTAEGSSSDTNAIIPANVVWPKVYGENHASDGRNGLVSKFEWIGTDGKGGVGTSKYTASMWRSDSEVNGFRSSYIESFKTGLYMTVDHANKTFMVVTPSQQKAAQAKMVQLSKQYPNAIPKSSLPGYSKRPRPVLRATGRHVKLGSHLLEEYVSNWVSGANTGNTESHYWVSRELAPFARLEHAPRHPSLSFMSESSPDWSNVAAVSVFTTIATDGVGNTRSRLVSIGMEPMSDADFKPPRGYKETKAPY